jgi:hypothetical protein
MQGKLSGNSDKKFVDHTLDEANKAMLVRMKRKGKQVGRWMNTAIQKSSSNIHITEDKSIEHWSL